MKLHFSKYHGTGNDFIIIDNRTAHWEPTSAQVSFICDRHFGIGADGLMLLSVKSGFDFAMTYFNSDGNESTMCGNGGRCMTAFAKSLGLVDLTACFWAADGPHVAEISNAASVYSLLMKDALAGKPYDDGLFIDTGSPHFVTFVKDAASTDILKAGKALRHDLRFAPGGTNVDFVELQADGPFVRTYERGVENETLSCGTGVTASALAIALGDPLHPDNYRIKTPGGELKVRFRQTGRMFTDIWLEGPAEFVFEGEVKVYSETAKYV